MIVGYLEDRKYFRALYLTPLNYLTINLNHLYTYNKNYSKKLTFTLSHSISD